MKETFILYGCVDCQVDEEGNTLIFAVPKKMCNDIGCPGCGVDYTLVALREIEIDPDSGKDIAK